MGYGLISLLVLVLDIYCIYLIINTAMESTMKLVWVLVVLFLPLLGPILYFTIGGGGGGGKTV